MTSIDMSPAPLDIIWYRGDGRAIVLRLPAGFNVTGWGWAAHVRRTPDGPLVAELDIEARVGTGDDVGRTLLVLTVPVAARAPLAAGTVWVWDLEARPPGEEPVTWFGGSLRQKPDVTDVNR